MDVRLPNGVVIKNVPEGTTKEMVMQKAISSGLAKSEDFGLPADAVNPEEKSFLSSLKESFTGSDRMTPQMESLEPVAYSPEMNALNLDALKSSAIGLFGSDESLAKSLESMGGKISQDEKGNKIVTLPSGSYALNKPGLSPSDIARGGSQAGAFALAGAAAPATVIGQGLAGGLTSLGMQGGVSAMGGEDINPNQVGIDTLLGAGGQILTNALGAGYRALTGRASPVDDSAKSALEFAKKNDLPLSTTDVIPPQTFSGKSAQSLGEKIPLTGTAQMRQTQQAARLEQIKQLSEKYGVPDADEISKSVVRKIGGVKEAAGKRYEQIISDMGADAIPLNKTVSTIDDAIYQYSKSGAARDPKVLSALSEFKDQITSGGNNLDLLRQNRTIFRELIKGENAVLSDTAQKINDRVYRAMTDDMLSGVESKLGTQARDRLKQADSIYAQQVGEIKNTKLKNILSKGSVKPEEATKMLFSGDASEFKTLYSSLDQAGRQNARAAIVNKAFDAFDSTDSADKFLTAMNKLRPQIGTFFKGEERKQLDGLVNWLDHTRQAQKASMTTPTGQQLFQVAPIAGAADVVGTGGVGVASTLSIGAMARIYESKPVRDILLKMASVPKGSTQFEKLSAELNRALVAASQAGTE